MVSKGRARGPFLWSFQGGHGGKFRNPPVNLSWGARGGILLIGKEYPLASLRSSSELSPPPAGRAHPGPSLGPDAAKHPWHPGCSTGHRRRGVVTPPYEAPGEPSRPQPGAKKREPPPQRELPRKGITPVSPGQCAAHPAASASPRWVRSSSHPGRSCSWGRG